MKIPMPCVCPYCLIMMSIIIWSGITGILYLINGIFYGSGLIFFSLSFIVIYVFSLCDISFGVAGIPPMSFYDYFKKRK